MSTRRVLSILLVLVCLAGGAFWLAPRLAGPALLPGPVPTAHTAPPIPVSPTLGSRPSPRPSRPPNAPPTPPVVVDHFTIPAGGREEGLHGDWGGAVGGFTITNDGSFWFADFNKGGDEMRMLHYGADGTRLPPRLLPGESRGALRLVQDLLAVDDTLWTVEGAQCCPSLIRLGTDGRAAGRYPLPVLVDGAAPAKGVLVRGGDGSVGLLLPAATTRVLRLVDRAGTGAPLTPTADGQLAAASETALPGGRGPISTRLDGPPGQTTHGRITVGTAQLAITTAAPLWNLQAIHGAADGSALVLAAWGPPPAPGTATLLFHVGVNGQLLGWAAVPGVGEPVALRQRLAVGPNGVYWLGGGWPQVYTVQRLTFMPPITPLPPPFLPSPTATPALPTATPTPAITLPTLAAEAALVVVGTVAQAQPWRERTMVGFTVETSLKGPGPLYLNLSLTADEAARLGGVDAQALLFLVPNTPYYWCEQTADFYTLVGAGAGVYPLRGGRVAGAGLATYEGWTTARFRQAVQAVLPPPPPPPRPDDGVTGLLPLAHSADLIAEVTAGECSAATQTLYCAYPVLRWLKKPPGTPATSLGLALNKCEADRVSLGRGHYILFLTAGDPSSAGFAGAHLTGETAGIFGVSAERITLAGLSPYAGWSVARFETALRSALTRPGTPVPELRAPFGMSP